MLVRTRNARRPLRRPGAAVVELAIIYSVLFLLLFGLILGAIAIFRYQQVAQVAREGSRWASVHGYTWAVENKQPFTTPQDVYEKAVRPRATNMDPARTTCEVAWDTSQKPYHTIIVKNTVVPVTNNVIVTVKYQWDWYPFGPVTLRSTSVVSMQY